MKRTAFIILGVAAVFGAGFTANSVFSDSQVKEASKIHQQKNHKSKKENNMKLGAFSVSLSVKDLNVSKAFYENLGFKEFGGGMEQNYLIMKNGNALIGLFQGMFKGNILTFNPGWDENANDVEDFDDVRKIQQHLKNQGVQMITEADETTTGPASFMITDPDGNVVLVDQHR